MQQTFVRSIHDLQVEFSRLLYPIHYKIFVREANKNPAIYTIKKDESNNWKITCDNQVNSLNEEFMEELIKSVRENESSSSD